MKILIACEFSGVVRDAFIKKGHEAVSCDLLPTETEGPHYQGDVMDIINDSWDLMIAHPPCTYLATSGLHWNNKRPERALLTEEALVFIQTLLNAPIERIALENPVGCIGTRIRKADQYIQPYEYGHDAKKKTCLWLKNLPLLKPTNIIIKEQYSNTTPSGQNNIPPGPDRWKLRSITYQGIADAMADQWG